jgi:hypothetical protein
MESVSLGESSNWDRSPRHAKAPDANPAIHFLFTAVHILVNDCKDIAACISRAIQAIRNYETVGKRLKTIRSFSPDFGDDDYR